MKLSLPRVEEGRAAARALHCRLVGSLDWPDMTGQILSIYFLQAKIAQFYWPDSFISFHSGSKQENLQIFLAVSR